MRGTGIGVQMDTTGSGYRIKAKSKIITSRRAGLGRSRSCLNAVTIGAEAIVLAGCAWLRASSRAFKATSRDLKALNSIHCTYTRYRTTRTMAELSGEARLQAASKLIQQAPPGEVK